MLAASSSRFQDVRELNPDAKLFLTQGVPEGQPVLLSWLRTGANAHALASLEQGLRLPKRTDLSVTQLQEQLNAIVELLNNRPCAGHVLSTHRRPPGIVGQAHSTQFLNSSIQ